MQETVLVSIPINEFKGLIYEAVKACLQYPPVQDERAKLLTEQQVVEMFDIPYPTLQALIKKSEIPFRVKGKHCYFSMVDVAFWKLQRNQAERIKSLSQENTIATNG